MISRLVTLILETFHTWAPQIFAGACVIAALVLIGFCLVEWRAARASKTVTVGPGGEVIGSDQVRAENRRRLRTLQRRMANRDPRRV